jgi:hypothetical protein
MKQHHDHPDRKTWQTKLRRELRKHLDSKSTSPALVDIMLLGIQQWMNHEPFPHERYTDTLQLLTRSQERIGWDQLLYGRWSGQWREQQRQYLQRNNLECSPFKCGPAWASTTIRLIWEHCHAEWRVRNQARHGVDELHRLEIRRDQVERKTALLYQLKPECTGFARRHYFYRNLARHFIKEPQIYNQEHWIETYEPMIRRSIKQQQENERNQLTAIDDYFRPIQSHLQRGPVR